MVGGGVVSRDSTSLDKDRTRLRKGLEDDRAVDLQGDEEVELGGLVGGRSKGQEELVGGVELRGRVVHAGMMAMAGDGVCGSGGNTDKSLEETGSRPAPEVDSPRADSHRKSSSLASRPVVTV